MREETKAAIRLAVKRWFLRQARNIVWRADDWIHKQELRLRVVRDSRAVAHSVSGAVQSPELRAGIVDAPPYTPEMGGESRTDFEPFPQMELLADDIGAETDSPSRAGQRQLRAKAERASAETRSASPSWAQIKQENARRRDSHRRPLWMVS